MKHRRRILAGIAIIFPFESSFDTTINRISSESCFCGYYLLFFLFEILIIAYPFSWNKLFELISGYLSGTCTMVGISWSSAAKTIKAFPSNSLSLGRSKQ